MKRIFSVALMAMMLSVTTSCLKAKKAEQLDRVVWSDDGTQHAYIVMRFEEKRSGNPLDGTTLKKNFSHQIYVADPDGLNRRPVSNEILGQNGFDLYYVKSSGYMVASFLQDMGNSEPAYMRYYQLLMDGTTRTLTTAPYMNAIPSPDGKYIARVQYFPESCNPEAPENESNSCHVDVEFLDAQTLVRFGKKEKVVFEGPSKMPDSTWNPAGEFVVTNRVDAFALKPGQTPIGAGIPGCLAPKSVSHHINADGTFVFPNGNMIDSRPANDDDARWGCQTIAS